MSVAAGLHVHIGETPRRRPGYLHMAPHADADVPFQVGQEFPFEDRAATVLTVGRPIGELRRGAALHFLLECRRAIEPHGLVRIAAPADDEFVRLAALAGLEPAKQVGLSERARRESAALHEAGADDALELTKRDRMVAGDPLVSILIPAYNPRFFEACIGSALAQTYDNIEIIVCDDSASPTIENIVRTRTTRFPIRYERNEARLRPRANFIRCFERARGEFVKFLCDDDQLAPTCVASLLETFRLAPDITLATSRRQRIDMNGKYLPDQPATLPIVATNAMIAGYTLANAMIMAGLNTIGEPSTVLFRKADLVDQTPAYFKFDGAAGRGIIDMVTWSALLLKGDAVYLRDCHSSFRIHPGQRQHDPSMLQRNADSIRGLQAAWLGLGLHERLAPDLLLVKPFPPPREIDWEVQPVQGVAARPVRSAARTPVGTTASSCTAGDANLGLIDRSVS